MPRKVVQPSSAHYTRLELCQLMGAHKRVKNCNILLKDLLKNILQLQDLVSNDRTCLKDPESTARTCLQYQSLQVEPV